jgi:hypothetical protein
MNRRLVAGLGAAGLILAGWGAAMALQNQAEPVANGAEASNATAPAQPSTGAAPRASAPPPSRGTTPMAQREAVIGLLNKRNGLWRDLRMKPGQALRVGDVIVRLRACEQTAPWEPEQLTGAFVQLDIRGADDSWRRVFSGWLYKESPSLNMVEHPVYDVWAKACTMRFPDIGAETETVSSGESGVANRSSARKSGDGAAPEPVESAPSSNAT